MRRLVIVIVWAIACSASVQAQPLEPRGRAWVEAYFTEPAPEGVRTPAYLAHFRAHVMPCCVVDLRWLQTTYGADTYLRRQKLNAIGSLALAYHLPASLQYRAAATLDTLRQVYRAVVDHIGADGRFLWETDLNPFGYDSQQHEHAWSLEPLLFGYLWIKRDLPSAETEAIEAALHRAGHWLYERPQLQDNNRGISWAAVLMLAGHYFEEPAWVALAHEHGPAIFEAIVLPNGQIGEHTEQYADGGPDANYTYTSLAYLYAYRLWSGNTDLDARLRAAARWLAGYTTRSQWPLVVGASVRVGTASATHLRDALPFFERMSSWDPYFASLAEQLLHRLNTDAPPAYAPEQRPHIVAPLFFALKEATSVAASDAVPPWQAHRAAEYVMPNVHYALVSRGAYQTGLVFRARSGLRPDGRLYRRIPAEGFALRGLQSWAWHDEPPIILPGRGGFDGRHSTACLGATCSAETDVAQHAGQWETLHAQAPHPAGQDSLTVFVDRRGPLWTVYAFTPAATVVAYGADAPTEDSLHVRWYMNRDFLAGHTVRPATRTVTFSGRQGRLHYLRGTASEASDHVVVSAPGGMNAFAFSGAPFRFDAHDPAVPTLSFADASGTYRLDLQAVLRDGQIHRAAPFRLTWTAPPPSSP
ncbi:MAG: hypothetical protein AAF970_03290 [Bacteroidota bacterium]